MLGDFFLCTKIVLSSFLTGEKSRNRSGLSGRLSFCRVRRGQASWGGDGRGWDLTDLQWSRSARLPVHGTCRVISRRRCRWADPAVIVSCVSVSCLVRRVSDGELLRARQTVGRTWLTDGSEWGLHRISPAPRARSLLTPISRWSTVSRAGRTIQPPLLLCRTHRDLCPLQPVRRATPGDVMAPLLHCTRRDSGVPPAVGCTVTTDISKLDSLRRTVATCERRHWGLDRGRRARGLWKVHSG